MTGEFWKKVLGGSVTHEGPPYTHTFTPPADEYDEDGNWIAPPDHTMATFFTEQPLVIEIERDEYWAEITGRAERRLLFNSWWARNPDAMVQFAGRTAWDAVFRVVQHAVEGDR